MSRCTASECQSCVRYCVIYVVIAHQQLRLRCALCDIRADGDDADWRGRHIHVVRYHSGT